MFLLLFSRFFFFLIYIFIYLFALFFLFCIKQSEWKTQQQYILDQVNVLKPKANRSGDKDFDILTFNLKFLCQLIDFSRTSYLEVKESRSSYVYIYTFVNFFECFISIIRYQEFLYNTNNLKMVIWFQVIINNTYMVSS